MPCFRGWCNDCGAVELDSVGMQGGQSGALGPGWSFVRLIVRKRVTKMRQTGTDLMASTWANQADFHGIKLCGVRGLWLRRPNQLPAANTLLVGVPGLACADLALWP